MTAAAVRRNGSYAPLSANYADDDAIATLDLHEDDIAELLYVRGLAYCARDLRTEGFISDIALRTGKVLRRRPKRSQAGQTDPVTAAAERLAEVGIWTREGAGYRVTAWLKWNKSWDEMTHKRATDRARKKTTTDEESAPTPTGTQTESERTPNGVVAPKHVTALHVTTRHDTSEQSSSTSASARKPNTALTPPAAAAALLDNTGPYVPQIRDDLATQLEPLITAGIPITALAAALDIWKTRKAGPGLLPHLVQDQLTPAQQADPRFAGLLADARSHA